METFNKAVLFMESVTRKAVVLIMIVMVVTVLVDVLARNTALRVRGLDEVARYALVWLVFLVTAAGARYGDLIGMTSLADALPARIRAAVWIVRRVLFLVFLTLFGWYAIGLLQMMVKTGRTSANLHIPLWFVYAPLFIGTLLMALSLLADLGVRLKRGTVGEREDPAEAGTWN